MINRQKLLTDLQSVLRKLEADLLERTTSSEVPEVGEWLRAEYKKAKDAERTAQTFKAWLDDFITQVAAAWVLSCVFARFLEDNELVDPPRIAGPTLSLHPPSGRVERSEVRAGVDRLQQARDEHTLFFQDPERAKLTDREYLLDIFAGLATHSAGRDVFGPHNPMNALPNWLGPDAAGELLRFFQKIDSDSGLLVHDFTDPPQKDGTGWDTRFLGDLYQDLSEAARKKYALLQTPDFVEEFILDRTLEPALDEFTLTPGAATVRESEESDGSGRRSASLRARLEGLFKMIDPACGSGHFLLGSFPRILNRWQKQEPGTNVRVLVQRTLDSIHGVDINPFAIAIARFRLLLAALKACDIHQLKDAPGFAMNLACGDSLYHGRQRQQTLGDWTDESHYFRTEDAKNLNRILQEGTFHAVVANPPYIVPKDRAANQAYRQLYPQTCHMKYSLAVPFMERILRLAVSGQTEPRPSGSGTRQPLPNGRGSSCAGFTGQITANSFMKREFGKKLIESWFPTVNLTHVIDTSGAYIPGHGTPTVILLARNQKPVSSTIRTVLGIRGEPSTPDDPSQGLVWSAIVDQIDQPASGAAPVRKRELAETRTAKAAVSRERLKDASETASSRARLATHGDFVSVGDSSRDLFHKHPWSIGGGGASELKEQLEEATTETLNGRSEVIGITAVTGEDDLFMEPLHSLRRRDIELTRRLVVGDVIRDWSIGAGDSSIWLYDRDFSLLPLCDLPKTAELLWSFRAAISQRRRFGTPMVQRGLAWYEWQELYKDKLRTPLTIVVAEVATHNHFVLDRGGKVFKQTAPVIKLPAMIQEPRPSGSDQDPTLPDGRGSTEMRPVTEDDHLALLGLLNSSTACFWMKQGAHNKGDSTDNKGARTTGDVAFNTYAYNSSLLKKFPLPSGRPLELARRLDQLATELQGTGPAAILTHSRQDAKKNDSTDLCASAPLRETLDTAHAQHDHIRGEMIRLQEDLDWQCYQLYELLDEHLFQPPSRDRQGVESGSVEGDRFLTGAAPVASPGAAPVAGPGAGPGAGPDASPGAVLWNDDWAVTSNDVSPAETEPQVFFCTFTCYGTWLHGDARGSVDRDHNQWGTPRLEPDEDRERREFELLKHDPVKLGSRQRSYVHAAIIEVCETRGWRLHAINVRTNHVHVVVTANRKGKRVLNDFKSYGTRKMKEHDALPDACVAALTSHDHQEADDAAPPKIKVWTRGGSARLIDSDNSFRRAITYTLEEQGPDITSPPPAEKSHDREGVKSLGMSHDREEVKSLGMSHDREEVKSPGKSHDREGVKSRLVEGDRFLTGAAPDASPDASPSLRLGERAFEIVLARKMAAGEVTTTWFERHGSTPITDVPANWPDDYKELVQRRIDVIESNANIALIEQPEYKRRWNTESWDSQVERALRSWLLDRLESYFDFDGRMSDCEPHGASRGSETDDETPAASALPLTPPLADIQLVSVAKLADVARQDQQFMEVAEVYRDDPAFDVQRLVEELVQSEHVPLLPVLRYKPSGLRNRAEWEKTWELQRLEDSLSDQLSVVSRQMEEATDDGERKRLKGEHEKLNTEYCQLKTSIPVPPKYKSSDFISTGGARYWSLRGKLDVPKERWVSFPHCEGPDGTLMIAWAGYNHLQLAQAISAYYVDVQERLGGADDPRLIPLLAGVIELLPWLKQWHHEIDPEYNQRMDEVYEGFVTEEAKGLNLTIEEIKAWEPPKNVGRAKRTKKVSK